MLNSTAAWQTPATDDLLDTIMALPDREAAERFFRDLCTLREIHDLAQRWQIVRLLEAGHHYGEIARETGASTATVTRIASWLNHGAGGYRDALDRTPPRAEQVPARGEQPPGSSQRAPQPGDLDETRYADAAAEH